MLIILSFATSSDTTGALIYSLTRSFLLDLKPLFMRGRFTRVSATLEKDTARCRSLHDFFHEIANAKMPVSAGRSGVFNKPEMPEIYTRERERGRLHRAHCISRRVAPAPSRQHGLDLKLPLRPPRIGLNRNLCRVATRRPELGYTVCEREGEGEKREALSGKCTFAGFSIPDQIR